MKWWHESSGIGHPMLLLSGGPGLSSNYLKPVVKILERDAMVIRADQRGTGKSIADPRNCTLENYLQDMEELRMEMGLDKWILFGHSWGGMLASAYAERWPQRVEKLILSNCGGLRSRIFGSINDFIFARLPKKQLIVADTMVRSMSDRENKGDAQVEFLSFVQPAYFADAAKANLMQREINPKNFNLEVFNNVVEDLKLSDFDIRKQLQAFKGPTLIMSGAEDLLGIKPVRELQKSLPHAETIIFNRTGHYPWLEAKDDFRMVLHQFLNHDIHELNHEEEIIDLSGSWEMYATQQLNGTEIRFHGTIELIQRGTILTGTIQLNYSTASKLIKNRPELNLRKYSKMNLEGEIRNDFVKFSYDNPHPDVQQYGSSVLKITNSKIMAGRYVGYGPENNEVIHGIFSTTRE